MAEPIVAPQLANDGQEMEIPDFQNIGAVAGLADDRVIAEILRMSPYDGNVYKSVVPYGFKGALGAAYPGQTVQTSGSANASVVVSPFRFVVGSRAAANAAPPGLNPALNFQPNSLANWRDVRSGIFVGSSTVLASTIQLGANASGQPRWDLIYAVITPDAPGPSQTRRIKSPSTASVSTSSIPAWYSSPVSVSVVQGTAGASPALPAIPADSAGNYYAPLAYVWVPNGFTSGSTILSKNIRAFANGTSNYVQVAHGVVEPASGSNDRTGTYATASAFQWDTTGGVRPGPFIAPDCVGAKEIICAIDAYSGAATWSHANGSVVDNSVDWRNRWFRVDCMVATNDMSLIGGVKLASDPTATGGTVGVPFSGNAYSPLAGTYTFTQFASSFGQQNGNASWPDGSGHPIVFQANGMPGNAGGGGGTLSIGLYVNSSTGALKFYGVSSATTTIGYIFFWVRATAPHVF